MGEGRQDARADPARTYATVIGAGLLLFGLSGFFYNSSFASGEALVAEKAFGLCYVNGWQNLLHLIAGFTGLALAPLLPRLYCLASGLIWTVLAAGGFFGAHGGEAVPSMAGLIPAGTANDLLCLLLGGLAFAALAAARAPNPTGDRTLAKARKIHRTKAQVKPETGVETGSSSSIGRPRSASRAGNPRRTIN